MKDLWKLRLKQLNEDLERHKLHLSRWIHFRIKQGETSFRSVMIAKYQQYIHDTKKEIEDHERTRP